MIRKTSKSQQYLIQNAITTNRKEIEVHFLRIGYKIHVYVIYLFIIDRCHRFALSGCFYLRYSYKNHKCEEICI